AQTAQQCAEARSVFCQVGGFASGSQDVEATRLEPPGQVQRCLPAKLDNHTKWTFCKHYVGDIFESDRLEVKDVGNVVIGGNGLRIAVHHDRLNTKLSQSLAGLHA